MNNINKELLNSFECFITTATSSNGRKRSQNTVKGELIDVKQFLDYIGDLDAKEATVNDVNKWIEANEWKVASKNRKKASVRTFYNCLVDNRVIENSPVSNLKFEEITRGKYGNQTTRDWLEDDEITRFKHVIEKQVSKKESTTGSGYKNGISEMINLRWRALFSLMLESGLRVNEVCELELYQLGIDQNGERYVIIPPDKCKTHKEREIPIPKYVIEYIKEYKESVPFETDSNYVFLSQNGNMLCESNILNKIKEFTKLAKIDKHITPHSLRHTFASYKVNVEKAHITDVADWMGDTEQVIKEIYRHKQTRIFTPAI